MKIKKVYLGRRQIRPHEKYIAYRYLTHGYNDVYGHFNLTENGTGHSIVEDEDGKRLNFTGSSYLSSTDVPQIDYANKNYEFGFEIKDFTVSYHVDACAGILTFGKVTKIGIANSNSRLIGERIFYGDPVLEQGINNIVIRHYANRDSEVYINGVLKISGKTEGETFQLDHLFIGCDNYSSSGQRRYKGKIRNVYIAEF